MMKHSVIQLFMALILVVLFIPIGNAVADDHEDNPPTSSHAEFIVLGNCEMCKSRIERAAYSVPGVRMRRAEWDEENQMLSVRYRPNRTSQEEIERAIARVGHDTENFLADDETYENLPSSCTYPRDPEMLENNRRYDEE